MSTDTIDRIDARVDLRRRAIVIAATYGVVAGVWIALSDPLLATQADDSDGLVRLSVYKGFFFVTATAALLYALLRSNFAAIERAFVAARFHQAKSQQADAIVTSTGDAIISVDLDGTISGWNPAAEQMFGYRAEEIVGSPAQRLLPADRAAEASTLLRRLEDGDKVSQLETVRLRKDGLAFPVAITFSPIPGADNATERIVGVSQIIRDITERRLAASVAEGEQRFARALIEALPGVFYLCDEEGRFLRWNRNLESVSGYSAEEIAELHPVDLIVEDDRPLVQERIADVFEAGASSAEARMRTKSGSERPYVLTGRRTELDGATCLIGIGVDITERKHAEEALRHSEERFRSTLDSIIEGCQLLDFNWRYLYLNDAAAVQNRRPNSELLGQRMQDMWPGIVETSVFAMIERSMGERIALYQETEFTFPDGGTGWFEVRAQPVPEGVFVLSIEISERKEAERALRELNEGLELVIARRTSELEVALERAEAADEIKSAFLATMSHELRTPLNSIIGFTGILLQSLAGPLSEEQFKQLSMVQGSARHLLDLINDVLDISKIEAGQLEVRSVSFDLAESIERVIAMVTPQAESKGLRLSAHVAEGLGHMVSDPRRVEQILLNVLNNAIKFTDRGEVTLTAGVARDGTDRLARVEVADTGIGMRPEDLAQLFQPFRQIDSGLQRQHEGTGLGLAICRRLSDLLGGGIRVESTRGEGSVFIVELPMERTPS